MKLWKFKKEWFPANRKNVLTLLIIFILGVYNTVITQSNCPSINQSQRAHNLSLSDNRYYGQRFLSNCNGVIKSIDVSIGGATGGTDELIIYDETQGQIIYSSYFVMQPNQGFFELTSGVKLNNNQEYIFAFTNNNFNSFKYTHDGTSYPDGRIVSTLVSQPHNWSGPFGDDDLEFNVTFFTGYTSIPDANFEQALIAAGIDSEGTLDGQILTGDAFIPTTLNMSGEGIQDLTGIDAFKNVTQLRLNNNMLSSIDLSGLAKLVNLFINNNNLTSLDLSSNQSLGLLRVKNNPGLSSLHLPDNSDLFELVISDTSIDSLDLSNQGGLEILKAENCALTDLNLSGNPLLRDVLLTGNLLDSLNFNNNPALINVLVDNNQLTRLFIKNGNNSDINSFNASGNLLSCIDVDNETAPYLSSWVKDSFTVFSTACQLTYIPDDNFEQALLNKGIDTDGLMNDYVFTSDVSSVTKLKVHNQNISDLTGIQDFTSLTLLWCYDNNLSSIDITSLVNLDTFQCHNNNISAFDLTQNTQLEKVRLYNNPFTDLDISTLSSLKELFAGGSLLTSLDVSQNTQLDFLNIQLTSIDTLDLSLNSQLTTLRANQTDIRNLDLSANTNLEELRLFQNSALTGLILSSGPILSYIDVQNTSLDSLDLSGNPGLTTCRLNDIPTLEYLNIQNGNNEMLTTANMYAANLPLISCIIVSNPSYCIANWTNIDPAILFTVYPCEDVTIIPDPNFEQALIDLNIDADGHINQNALTSNLTSVMSLNITNKNIDDVTGLEAFTSLKTLLCYNNNLTTLDLSNNTALVNLQCYNNMISSIDVSMLTDLITFYPAGNNISQIDVSNNPKLKNLNLQLNPISTLDVSNNPDLIRLRAHDLLISALDLRNNPDLTGVFLNNNPNLSYLDLRNGNNSLISTSDLVLINVPTLSCVHVSDTAYCNQNWTIIDPQVEFGDDYCPSFFDGSFMFSWDATTNQSISLNTSGNGHVIDWGDGTYSEVTTSNTSHTYATPGIYTLKISTEITSINFGNSNDPALLLEVLQWGNAAWNTMGSTFNSCTNMLLNAPDVPDLSNVTSLGSMFSGCSSFNSPIGHWDVSNVENFGRMFRFANSFNQPLNNWDVSSMTNTSQMFQGATSFDQNIGNWDISSLSTAVEMFKGSGVSIVNFDSLLMGWATLSPGEIQIPINLTFSAGSSRHCLSGSYFNELNNTYGWNISGGGIHPQCHNCSLISTFENGLWDIAPQAYRQAVIKTNYDTDINGSLSCCKMIADPGIDITIRPGHEIKIKPND